MADEKTQTTQAADTEESIVENFIKTSAEVETQRKGTDVPDKDTPDKGGKTVGVTDKTQQGDETPEDTEVSEVSGEPEETPAGELEMSEEDTEILNGIDPDVADVCRASGWDNKRIVDEAKTNPGTLGGLRELLDEEQSKKTEQPVQSEKKEERPEVDEIDGLLAKLDPDIQGPEIVGILKAIVSRQKEGHKVLTEGRKRLDAERQMAFTAKIDNILDGHAKSGYRELGNSTVRLGYKEKELRKDVVAVANALAFRANMPVERTIGRAVGLFKNQGGEKAATQKLINKLNKQDERAINRPTRRISQQKGERKFADNYEEAEYEMTKAEQEAGLTT